MHTTDRQKKEMSTIKAMIFDVLDKHGVRDPVLEVLLWEKPTRSGALFLGGISTFILVQVFGIGMLTVIGTLAILQLFIYRTAQALQTKGLINKEIDLQDVIVLTPDASTISTSIEIIGDILRTIEETIKEISLTPDYVKLVTGIATLIVLSALGRVVSLPILLVLGHIIAFTFPLFYSKNEEKIDSTIANALDATEMFLEKTFNMKIKLQ